MENKDKEKQEASVSEKDMQEISVEEITKNLNDITTVNVAVWRKNNINQLVVLPVKKLDEYLKEKDADKFKFFIDKNWKERIKEHKAELKNQEPAPEAPDDSQAMKQVEKFGKVDEQVSLFGKMSVVEREEILDECISKLSEDSEKKQLNIDSIVYMVSVLSNTFYANNANLEQNIATENVKDNINGVLVKSAWIVKILIDLFDQKKYPYGDLKIIEKISTGSKTIDHINKVFLRFVSFCSFYNEYIGEGLFTKNIRGAFKDKYHRHYKKRLPTEEVSIERIFKDGIRRIDKEKEIQNYILGALLFDIGKLRYIGYHDGSDPYDEDTVKKHALHGYNMLIKARQYPFEVFAMAVFHHEYYGGKGSYGFTKPLLSKFTGKKFTEEDFKYFISYNKDDFIHGISLAYFPCKVLEIIDIFDALTGKKNYPVVEALTIMKKEFITKSFKIDPVIFKIFLEYNVKCGTLENSKLEEIDNIIF
ncbi:MAG: hypothetical protein V1874_00485 [Spirochaetota bacterium]